MGFILAGGAYKLWETVDPATPFLHAYFEDLIAIPVILGIALFMTQWLLKKWRSYTISLRDLILLTVVFSLYFEVILPRFNAHFSSDLVDVGCYALGTIFFARFLNRPYFAPSEASH